MPRKERIVPIVAEKVKPVGDAPDGPAIPRQSSKKEIVFDGAITAQLKDEVFALGYIPLDSFAKKLKETKRLSKEKKIPLTRIDFGRDGYVTDALLKKVFSVLGKEDLSEITRVSLEGCSLVTDFGLHWLVQALEAHATSKAVQVNINGCTRVKDGGLALLANSPNISNMQAIATSVSYLNHLGNTKGCPLLNGANKTGIEPVKQASLLIVPVNTSVSLSEFLVNKKPVSRQPFHYTRDLALMDWKVNIAEAESNHMLFETLLPENPVHVIIPFDAKQDVQELKTQVINTVAHVLSKEKPNPRHLVTTKLSSGSGFMDNTRWSKCGLSDDGVLRNTSFNQNTIGAVISNQPLSRTNPYFEVQCIQEAAETGILLGIMHDILLTDRFPLNAKEKNGGAVDGFEPEEGAVYGFGVEGSWESEYIPGKDAAYYFTKNGVKVQEKQTKEKPHIGMFPIVSVMGKNEAAVKFLNMAQPPEFLIEDWESKKMIWTPGFLHNVLCDDRGVLSYKSNYHTENEVGLMICQQSITREMNTFSIRIVSQDESGIVTLGIGPETYSTNRQPGWDKMSLALHGDNGELYLESGSGVLPSSGKRVLWKEGDEITLVVTKTGAKDFIESSSNVVLEYFVNGEKVAVVKHQLSGNQEGIRFAFMVGLRYKGTKVQMQNFREMFHNPPPMMDKLTMGRSNFVNIYDDGKLVQRKFDKRELFSIFISKTPFNKNLTYFEVKIVKLSGDKHAGVGFAHRNYPTNNMVGWQAGSIGYHADNGEIYDNSPQGEYNRFGISDTRYSDGDVIGCGIEQAKFREDGSLENQQTLLVYFTKNGIRVYEKKYVHEAEGMFPAVNLHFENDVMFLENYYHGPEPGQLVVEPSKLRKASVKPEDAFVEGCKITVVGVGSEKDDATEKIKLLSKALENMQFPILAKIEEHIRLMERNSSMMDQQGQELYGQLCWQRECLQHFCDKQESRLNFMTVNVTSGEGHAELTKHICQIFDSDLTHHSKFYEFSEKVRLGFQKILKKLETEKLMLCTHMKSSLSEEFGLNEHVYEAAVRHLQSKGSLLWVPMKRIIIAIDMGFTQSIVERVQSMPTSLSATTAPCIGNETKIWTDRSEIMPDLKKNDSSTNELLSHVLLYFGVMAIPRLRVSQNDSMFCFCTRQNIGALPVTLSEFTQTIDVVLMQRDYYFLYSSPSTVLSIVVSRCLMFSQAIAVAREFSVFQTGAVQTVIHCQGEQGLRVESRCFMPSEKSERINSTTQCQVEEYAFNVFSIFTDFVDSIIRRLDLKVTYTQKVPQGLVNSSIGCIHHWGLSNDEFRQTLCTLCGRCCDKGRSCPQTGIKRRYHHQCGCRTQVIGCRDCGICETCADMLWTIRSYLRPNCEVASYGDMGSSPYIPLNATTYDEFTVTNLSNRQAAVCLKGHTGLYYQAAPDEKQKDEEKTKDPEEEEKEGGEEEGGGDTSLLSSFTSSPPKRNAPQKTDMALLLTRMFPGAAIEYPGESSLEESMKTFSAGKKDKMLCFDQGDTITIRLDPIKTSMIADSKVDEEKALDNIVPVYHTCICRETTVWHDTGLVVYSSVVPSVPVSQFISANPLTPECNSFSFEIVNYGDNCYIAIGVCPRRYRADRQPGWDPGSLGYHADDGGIYAGSGFPTMKCVKCVVGDIMKCELDFQTSAIKFYKNDTVVYTASRSNLGNLHAAVGMHSLGEAVRLIEKEPWRPKEDEELELPRAFDAYKYGNIYISPGRTLSLTRTKYNFSSWLMLYNPSRNVIGYKIFPSEIFDKVEILRPGKSVALRIKVESEISTVDIHWFLLESDRDYANVDLNEIYEHTTAESLLKHRLNVKVVDKQLQNEKPLKLASEEPEATDAYVAEVFKNGILVQSYWLKKGNYICSIPLDCNVLVRYPKFPTMDQPNQFHRGMRVLVDISNEEPNMYAEALIDEATADGLLRLEYSLPGDSMNACMEVTADSPLISLKELKRETLPKAEPAALKKDGEEKTVSNINVVSFEARGNVMYSKRAYVFPPSHLLTEATREAIATIDSDWKSNTLQSAAHCKTIPTRITVQELQISMMAGSRLDWLSGANPSKKFDLAFAFLPSKLGYKQLCHPTIPGMFIDVDVHRLCFLVDQLYYNMRMTSDFGIMLDTPLHFVNIPPVTPSPALSPDTMFASAFNGWVYSILFANKLHLPLCDNIFPDGKPPFERIQLERLLKCMIHVYAAQCHIFAEQYGGLVFQETPENGTATITSAIDHSKEHIVQQTPEGINRSDCLIKKPFRNNVYCKTHQWCLSATNPTTKAEMDFSNEYFSPYEETVSVLFQELPNLTQLPADVFERLRNLQYMKLASFDKLRAIPEGISKCFHLEMVSLRHSSIEELPNDLFHAPNLRRLHCGALKVKKLPSSVMEGSKLSDLVLTSLLLTSVPASLGQLVNLEILDLSSNPLDSLPMELAKLTKLKTLLLGGIPWILTAGAKAELPMDQYEDFLKDNPSLKEYIGKERLMKMFHDFDTNKNSTLDQGELAALNSHLFWEVPRIGSGSINDTEYGGIPPVIFFLQQLEVLNLDYQAITMVPIHMCRLQNLKQLSISNNPLLESLPGALGHLPSLKTLRLMSNPSLRTPPHEVVSRGFMSVKAYLKRLAGGFTECRRTKLMLVGLGGAGKTSLLRALMSPNKKTAGTKDEDITDGIMIQPWKIKNSKGVEVTYSAWDFAGQTLYYNTHQFFLSKRAVYLLLWSTRQGFDHAGLDFWLSSVASHAPKTPIFVVGTHCDQVPKAEIDRSTLKERYKQIADFFFVSSLEGTGVAELEEALLRVTLEQKNMGEKIPQVWLSLEKKILAARAKTSILPWKIIKEFGMEIGIYDEKDIREAIKFLHELGTVQYFDNDFLRDQVVINPQWIVNVMACVVSVKNSPIQDHNGRFLHKFIPQVWSQYSPDLHRWLLRLTEEFDLTFPLPKDEVNIVPCLLPHDVPKEFNWPDLDPNKNIRETKMVYRFTYLPTGLFNRAQVRLFQFSDGKLVWKKGSLLKKNKNLALIEQISESELLVKVQGPRPENIIFLIHEIFESLIEESFHGVIYDFLLPCPDCVTKEGTLDPSLFEGGLVRKAREHKAPFLQCRKYFHTISMAQLFEVMPSDSASDFDAQLHSSLAIMQQLNQELNTDVAIIYSSLDMVDDNHPTSVSPQQIKKDIESAGFSSWFTADMDTTPVQDIMLALKNCKVVVALVSDNFEADAKSSDLLLYTMDGLTKDYLIVVIGDSLAWQNTDMGMRIGKQELMVMVRNKSRYEAKLPELIKGLQEKTKGINAQITQHPSIFLSYCWSNSAQAKAMGTKCPPGSIGWGDPREIKKSLEERGITVWLDIDQPSAGKGLFKNITDGIRNSKVLVVCVSDEYVKSDNCMMEMRFAVLNMNLPTVVCVVGTGKEWKRSEVGILMQRANAAKVYFQEENPTAMDTLEKFIRERLPENLLAIEKQKAAEEQSKMMKREEKQKKKGKRDTAAFQEEYELMQRKFMRHIISYVSSMDSVPTPRLIVIDLEKSPRELNKRYSENDNDSMDGNVRRSQVRPTLRPKTATRSRIMAPVHLDDEEEKWEAEGFVLRLLCEHEEGWHVCRLPYPVKMTDELKDVLKKSSAYMARMFAILRQSAVRLNCFDGTVGRTFTQWIEQNATENLNFIDAYTSLRTRLTEENDAQEFISQLHRCHLPTGKVYWLCEKHSQGPRIAKLSTELSTSSEVGRVLYEEDTKLRENLEASPTYKQKKSKDRAVARVNLPPLDMPAVSSMSSSNNDNLLAALNINNAALQHQVESAKNSNENKNQPSRQMSAHGSAQDQADGRDRKNSLLQKKMDPQTTPKKQSLASAKMRAVGKVGSASTAQSTASSTNKNSKTCSLQ